MRVKVYNTMFYPHYEDIENTLEAMQEIVGGYIEMVNISNGNCIVCNDEGRLLSLPYNKTIEGFDVYGDFFIVGVNNDGECEDIHE